MNKKLWLFLGASVALLAFSYLISPAPGVCLAVTVITAARATAGTQGIDSNSRVIDMSDTIHVLDPNTAPLMSLTNRLRKAHCVNPKFEWLEDEYLPTSVTKNTGTTTAGETALTIITPGGGYLRKGDVLKVISTGEVMYVSAVGSDTAITVVRGIGATAAADIAASTPFLIIGNASQEGATGRVIKTTQKTPLFNYTQIFRWPYGITRTLENSELYGGNDMAFQARKAGVEHKKQIEAAFLFGEKAEATTAVKGGDGATPIRYTDGLFARITSNVSSPGTLSMDTLETFIRSGYRYGSSSKLFFASRKVMSYINQIAANKIQSLATDKSFPLVISRYISPHGDIFMVEHRQLNGQAESTTIFNAAYHGWGALVDLDGLWYRYLQNSDTRVRTNIQAPDVDGRTDEYLSECGLMLVQERQHAVLNNVLRYA